MVCWCSLQEASAGSCGSGPCFFLSGPPGIWDSEWVSIPASAICAEDIRRPISVSAVPFGPGTDIWRSCRFIGALMRSLCLLPGGLRRFVPCSFGANHCRLRHIGWEKCGHGLTSRPRESSSELFLDDPFVTLLGLGVLYLLALFLFGSVLLGLLAGLPLGGYRNMVMLLFWLGC